MLDINLGERLKKVRLDKGYKLKDVAAKSGYSKALISRVENGAVSPSIESLMKIASALEIKPQQLFLEDVYSEPVIVHEGRGKKSKQQGGKVEVENLTVPSPDKRMEPLLIRLERGGSVGNELTGKGRTLWAMVVNGKVEFELDGVKHDLEKGDCAYFDSTSQFGFQNDARTRAEIFLAMSGSQ